MEELVYLLRKYVDYLAPEIFLTQRRLCWKFPVARLKDFLMFPITYYIE
jgi:hypothetical protein